MVSAAVRVAAGVDRDPLRETTVVRETGVDFATILSALLVADLVGDAVAGAAVAVSAVAAAAMARVGVVMAAVVSEAVDKSAVVEVVAVGREVIIGAGSRGVVE